MPLPSTIAIGPMEFSVTDDAAEHAKQVVANSEDPWGRIDYGVGTITLRPGQSAAHQRFVVLHEVLHGCWHVTDPIDPNNTEEMAIRAIAGPLLDTLRRNPALVAFLVEG